MSIVIAIVFIVNGVLGMIFNLLALDKKHRPIGWMILNGVTIILCTLLLGGVFS
jgi:uncharacterized membrane protein HdeD (DUF308 family)